METAKSLGVKLARALYGRWRTLTPASRGRLEALAEQTKGLALEVRGATDAAAATRDLHAANETFAAALLEDAEADPEIDEIEVRRLRDDLRRELERLASAEIKASRGEAERSRQQ
jgi:hypothetical protein